MTDYTKLVNDLRETAKHLDGISRFPYDDDPAKRIYSKKMTDAADAIEELQKGKAIANRKLDSVLKKVPKCGEWKRDEKRWGENSIRCSLCGAVIEDEEWGWRNWNYCYHCGAKMTEVQDDSISAFADGEWWKEARE